jgi:hypothetical protein
MHTRIFTTTIVLALTAAASAQSVEGWRTPDGELYFGAAPPAGSKRIEGVRPRRTMQPSSPAPTVTPRSTTTPKPTATPRPTALPTARPTATSRPTHALPEASLGDASQAMDPSAQRELACGDFVAIRDTRPTIDFDADRVIITGEVLVTTRPVRDLLVCLAGSCAPVAGGKVLAEGETARFRVAASGRRRRGLSVQCSVVPLP